MRYHNTSIQYTLQDLELGDIIGAELSLSVEIDPGQRGQFHGPPEDCCEEIPASATITSVTVTAPASERWKH